MTAQDIAAGVLDAIEAHPENFSMGMWFSCETPHVPERLRELAEPSWGTTMCVAGWTIARYGTDEDRRELLDPSGDHDHDEWVPATAADLLGLDWGDCEPETANELFYSGESWALDLLRKLAGR